MSGQELVCDGCGRKIEFGERYVAYLRNIEVANKPGPIGRLRGHEAVITVKDPGDGYYVHLACDKSGGAR